MWNCVICGTKPFSTIMWCIMFELITKLQTQKKLQAITNKYWNDFLIFFHKFTWNIKKMLKINSNSLNNSPNECNKLINHLIYYLCFNWKIERLRGKNKLKNQFNLHSFSFAFEPIFDHYQRVTGTGITSTYRESCNIGYSLTASELWEGM